MKLTANTHNFHVLDYDGNLLLYDVNRVKTFQCSIVEKKLLNSAFSGSEGIGTLVARYGEEVVDEGIRRLNRLSGMSDSLASYSGQQDLTSGEVTTLWLNVTNACNLKCRYCYAREGAYATGPENMSSDIARAGIDLLLKLTRQTNACVIVFAGGEPLLNFPVIKSTIEYTHRKLRQQNISVVYRILTNGTVMDAGILKLLTEYGVGLQISMDGPAEIHNCNRRLKDGRGSFKKVEVTLQFLKKNQFENYSVRSTMCHEGMEADQLKNFLKERGFEAISLIPVMAERHNPLRLDQNEVKDLSRFYLEQSKEIVNGLLSGKPATIFEDIPLYLEKLKFGIKSKRFCGAGHGMLVLTPGGDLYPCPSLASSPEFHLGSLRQGLSNAIIQQFTLNTVDRKAACKICWARNLCGGGCAALSWQANQNIEEPDTSACETLKAKITGAIYIHNRLMGQRR